MNVFAYCTRAAREAVGAAVDASPLTSPPMRASRFDPQWLEGYDLLYFRLHGKPHSTAWYNDEGTMSLAPIQVARADLGGAVVVAATCYGAENGAMVRAFYEAGAALVIAGPGENVAAAERVVGVDLLVQWVIRLMRLGAGVERALQAARWRLRLTGWRASDRDAAQFAVVGREYGVGSKEVGDENVA
jgi:hypothetical protein